ncbi:hypothetical protein PV08_10069 [Exophiala spinifera]|uniref:Fumarylacetoacetase-like C-terminal domain-containing protein n=1 Tax=Exophiala spinifera TaxID=91928 RepID=A0A0D2AW92_9EURO|nr:uncharacterized protein PV08_10069 [Exophiala spinifera]KIW10770.1 hypothetical protein PV08_10069 [Exophiala spinifera]
MDITSKATLVTRNDSATGTGLSSGQQGLRYAAFKVQSSDTERIGSFDADSGRLTQLTYASGTRVRSLYEVIEARKSDIVESNESFSVDEVDLLPPIYGRDVLAVGKNYAEHAKEFNASGYDSSDKVDQPTHPVIFTKRATSIVAHGTDIYFHPSFTHTLDYEGEIGAIIGKRAFQVPEENAFDYLWGYTIINDVTAREKQRDHKQFFLGKSADTFCPMGPVAMAKEDLPDVLEVVTLVNSEERQRATTKDLIFSVPHLISVISQGQTLLPGDVIATGTPAGVGFGFNPPKWLQPGDEVEISVTGLGKLKNRVGNKRPAQPFHQPATISTKNDKALSQGLTKVGATSLFYKTGGTASGKPTIFVHGLGGTHEYFNTLAERLPRRWLHLFDFEGHGLSRIQASQSVSIESIATDIKGIAAHAGITSGLTVIAHSMGCLSAMKLAAEDSGLVDELVLMGPPPSPLPAGDATTTHQRASTVRGQGMHAVAEAVARIATSAYTQEHNPLAFIGAKLSLLSQDPEGYAKACHALADTSKDDGIDMSGIKCRTLILTGREDKVSPPALCEKYASQMPLSELTVIDNVAHWHLFEDHLKTIDAVDRFLS